MNLEKLTEYRSSIIALAEKYHSSNVRVFGSIIKDENIDLETV